MAHHKSAIKRIKQSEARRLQNKYYHKTVRNAVRTFKAIKEKDKAMEEYKKLTSMIDKLAKRKVIHANNAANKKAGLFKHIQHLQVAS